MLFVHFSVRKANGTEVMLCLLLQPLTVKPKTCMVVKGLLTTVCINLICHANVVNYVQLWLNFPQHFRQYLASTCVFAFSISLAFSP